ncbi:MAG: DUF2160 domain-containing protein [Paracoccaceae bacterium]
MTASRWNLVYLVSAAILAAILALLVAAVPAQDGIRDWTAPLIRGGWMAWTFPVALFFWIIACLLILMTLLAIRWPETPRRGLLRIETTRGDRLFISLLGTAFICIFWMFLFGPPLWGALAVGLAYVAAVFRWV